MSGQKKHFVFIVFSDPVVAGAIDFLSSVMSFEKNNFGPHLTIQGPLDGKASLDSIASIKKKLKDDIFFIGNPGIFKTSKGVALFLRVNSDNLSKVWNKPDFPVQKYGFNPHITIYEGEDVERAERACAFLKKNRFELLCREFDVVQYEPKQIDMFPNQTIKGDESAISVLMARGKISASFRASFMHAVNYVKL